MVLEVSSRSGLHVPNRYLAPVVEAFSQIHRSLNTRGRDPLPGDLSEHDLRRRTNSGQERQPAHRPPRRVARGGARAAPRRLRGGCSPFPPPRLAAYAVGVSPSDICRYASGEEEPAADVSRRLRDLYTATWFIASTDGPGSAHDWLTLPNPKLDDRAPAELLREGESPEPVWFSIAPAF